MEIDYHHQTRQAVFSVCKDRVDRQGPTCRLAIAQFDAGDALVSPRPLLARGSDAYGSPRFSPDGSALYLTRRGPPPLGGRRYEGASEIVRLDLTTLQERRIRQGHGLNFVKAIVEHPDGSEHLLLSGLGSPVGLGPVRGSPQVARYDPSDDRLTFGPPFQSLYGGSVGFALPGCGFAHRTWTDPSNGPPRQVYAGVTLDQAWRGEASLFGEFAPAVAHVAGASPACGVAAAHARSAAEVIDARPVYANQRFSALETLPQDVLARFDGRPFAFFPDQRDPFGQYHLAWDLRGGALAAPAHPLVGGRSRFQLFSGSEPQFTPTTGGVLDFQPFLAMAFADQAI